MNKFALEVAAQCWCDEAVSDREMDAELAQAFAKRLDRLMDVIEKANKAHWTNPPIMEMEQVIKEWETGKLGIDMKTGFQPVAKDEK